MKSPGLALLTLLLTGCVTRQPDHFYVIEPLPAAVAASRSQFDRQVTLRITIPSLVDRGEMVVATASGVSVMDHERWAAPLVDMISNALGQNIERRRSDVVVLPRSADKAGIPLFRVAVEIDQVSCAPGRAAQHPTPIGALPMRAPARKLSDAIPSSARTRSQSYANVAAALSACVALLADRLAGEIPAG